MGAAASNGTAAPVALGEKDVQRLLSSWGDISKNHTQEAINTAMHAQFNQLKKCTRPFYIDNFNGERGAFLLNLLHFAAGFSHISRTL